jgi:hypothetical protein
LFKTTPEENLPATQLVQAEAPAAELKLPASQMMQVAELVCPVAPEYLPAAHLLQSQSPFGVMNVLALYLPVSH